MADAHRSPTCACRVTLALALAACAMSGCGASDEDGVRERPTPPLADVRAEDPDRPADVPEVGAPQRDLVVPDPSRPPWSALAELGYDLDRPDHAVELPRPLREVSGLAPAGPGAVACLDDERGDFFFVEVASGRVALREVFGPAADYEGLARVGDELVVLRSDGWLGRFARAEGAWVQTRALQLDLDHREYEGLAHDDQNRRLLVVPKDRKRGKDADEDALSIFACDLDTGTVDVAFALSRKRLVREAEELNVRLPTRTTKKDKVKFDVELRPSGLAVHPVTGDLYLLSAADRALFVIAPDGALRGAHAFASPHLVQPEGLTFQPDGTLTVSSEGIDGPGVLHTFRPRAERR